MPIPSHTCTFPAGTLFRRLGVYALGIVGVAALVHAAAHWNLLPPPVAGDLDRTILSAKAELASRPAPASVVLLGDSSCMMNVDAPELGRLLEQEVLNLGTLSHLDLNSHTTLLRHFLEHQGTPPRVVVLLVHPAALRRGTGLSELDRFLRARLDGDLTDVGSPPRNAVDQALAGAVVRERMIQPCLPRALRGDFATAYGTTWQVRRLLVRQAGSLPDPTRFDSEAVGGRSEFRFGEGWDTASRELKAVIPAGTRLLVGLTPVPESFALPDHASQVRDLLETWRGWLNPDDLLTGLPATLPDSLFATDTHLSAKGIEAFTRRLATEMGAEAGLPRVP